MTSDSRFVSQRAYARHRDVNINAVTEAIKSGRLKNCLVLDEHGVRKISSVGAADQEWERNTDPARRAPDNAPAPAEAPEGLEGVVTATERLKSAQADLAELKYAEAAAELVPADQVMREWADVLSQVRTKMLGIPTALKQSIPHLTVEEVVIIENAIREALEDAVTGETVEAP